MKRLMCFKPLNPRQFLREVSESFGADPPAPKKFKTGTGLNKGETAKWVLARRTVDPSWELPTDPTLLDPETCSADPFYYAVGARKQSTMDFLDENFGRPSKDDEEEYSDIHQSRDRVTSSKLVCALQTQSVILERGSRRILEPHHLFALQGYNLRQFPQAAVPRMKTALTRLAGDAVTATVFQKVFCCAMIVCGFKKKEKSAMPGTSSSASSSAVAGDVKKDTEETEEKEGNETVDTKLSDIASMLKRLSALEALSGQAAM